MGSICVVGMGPGGPDDMTPAVARAISASDAIVGYGRYVGQARPLARADATIVDTGMGHERERALEAFRLAGEGMTVCVVSSGDAGIYGMASLVLEVEAELRTGTEISVLPGISAFQKAAALLGAPMGHDFCVISLSDLLTPWQAIERRIRAAAEADFVTAVYNPGSVGRFWQLHRLREVFLESREATTPVGIVRQAGRRGERAVTTTLGALDPGDVDMLTIAIIGNSSSYVSDGRFITPRGYAAGAGDAGASPGQAIMRESFATIMRELGDVDMPLPRLWTLLHVIHATADFDMARLLWMNDGAAPAMRDALLSSERPTIVTDVSMVASGIRKGALARLGVDVACYIDDPRVVAMAHGEGITRARAAMRVAAAERPRALYAFGNAPTALLELCDLVRRGRCSPIGIVAAPVGFVHVEESKHAVKALRGVPRIVIQGRKGGSPVAATIVNSVLAFDDAQSMVPGRDV